LLADSSTKTTRKRQNFGTENLKEKIIKLTVQKCQNDIYASSATTSQAGGTEPTKECVQVTGRLGAVGGVDTCGIVDVSSLDYKQSHNVETWHGDQYSFYLLITF
jgi:hypothetical protein